MSIDTDLELDRLDAGPEYPPTERERALVTAYKWGHITLPRLWQRLGLRAPHVCATLGIGFVRQPEPDGDTPSPLAHVTLAELLAELDRRSCG